MRASGASELENFHNYIHLTMQLLTITNNCHEWFHKRKGRSSFRNNNVFLIKMKWGQMRQKMHLLYLEGHHFLYIFFSMRKAGGRLRALT